GGAITLDYLRSRGFGRVEGRHAAHLSAEDRRPARQRSDYCSQRGEYGVGKRTMAIVKDAEFTEAIETTTDNDQQLQIPSELPVLPLRDIVIYPFMIVPLFVSREKSIRAVDEALAENRMILLASQKDLDKEEPTAE